MKPTAAAAVGLALAALMIPLLAGCSQPSDGDSKMEKIASDANAAATRSGGDWSKLSADEKTAMLKITHGNEPAAKQLLYGLSGKTHEGEWGTPEHPLGGPPGSGARVAAAPPPGAAK